MATVQVLPPSGTSSRKKDHLEAGKRRLEEFRKKKAADQAKKSTPSVPSQPAEAILHEKQPSESHIIRLTDSNGAEVAVSDLSSGVINNNGIKPNEYLHKDDSGSSYETYGDSSFYGNNDNNYASFVDKVPTHANDLGFQAYDNFNSPEFGNNYKFGTNFGTLGGITNGTSTEQASPFQNSFNNIYTSSSQYSYHGSHESILNNNDGERSLSSFVGHLSSGSSPSLQSTESRPLGFGQPNHVAAAGNNTKRTRPSFLDSISTSSVSSVSVPLTKPQKDDSFISKAHLTDIGASLNSTNSQVAAENGGDLFRYGIGGHNMERNHNFHSRKEDEDFSALEQHIEDLTQEKFALQRALEASRALAESLAAENSALTDSYNQQGSAVQQLKLDMEMLQEEIKAQLVELESMRIGYTNAQMECNAADERAKLLASEVIGLEEKALRLRSSELKLERQLENLQTEVSSSKKKISSLEKERKDLQLTIDAMQEEKKMLQSMLRKASTSGKSVDINKKDASTSTQDLDAEDRNSTSDSSNLEIRSTSLRNGSDSSTYLLQPENTEFSLEAPLDIPPDQLRTIQNINTLISELSLEKEELMQALSTESTQSSKLKELNMELSRKLEVQTQRLELLTAQNMVNGNIPPPRQLDSRPIHDNIAYADEGDEVVERVLGWIMKLFPGGPSKRRTSKLI